MLDVVQHQQRPTPTEEGSQLPDHIQSADLREAEGPGHGRQHQVRIGHRRQLRHRDTIGKVGLEPGSRGERQPSLADTTRPGESQQPNVARPHPPNDVGQVGVASEQGRRRGRRCAAPLHRSGVGRGAGGLGPRLLAVDRSPLVHSRHGDLGQDGRRPRSRRQRSSPCVVEIQRGGQGSYGVGVGPTSLPTLERPDSVTGQPSPVGELLLGERGSLPQRPESLCEGARPAGLLVHRP